jgi:succinate-semialdehyde dehydrogenase/glutarate-semialdehyde dehydrogenase
VAAALESGMVGVNDVAISSPECPFGGYKTSGIGGTEGRK